MTLSPAVPLTAAHDCAGFDCGEHVFNALLQQRSFKNESRFLRIYVLCEDDRVVAYVQSARWLRPARRGAGGALRRNAPDVTSVAIIGRLVVSKIHACSRRR